MVVPRNSEGQIRKGGQYDIVIPELIGNGGSADSGVFLDCTTRSYKGHAELHL